VSDDTTASGGLADTSDVPTDVAKAARLWAGDKKYAVPEYAAWANNFTWVVLRKTVVVAAITTLAVLAIIQARGLVGMLIISTFFALAIIPGVNALHARFGMKRGAAVGVVYLIALIALVVLVLVLIPAVVTFAEQVGENLSGWIADLNAWTQANLGGTTVASEATEEQAQAFLSQLAEWGGNVFGVVTSGIGFLFDFFTIAAFTFYIAAGFPNIRRAVASRMNPERQRVFAWITDTSIEQTGGYFYSRLLLMVVNGGLGFVVMVILGLPVVYALPMALFLGFVSEFIPMIGTYIGMIIPLLVILAVLGIVPAVLFVVWVTIYQQLENYWLSPRFSSQTMELNGAVAFGAALFGGAVAGPMGAFMALPVAALVTAISKNAGKTYAVVVEDLDGPELAISDHDDESTAHPRWQFWRK
jgi:predicted PurR-regulated permease PerM